MKSLLCFELAAKESKLSPKRRKHFQQRLIELFPPCGQYLSPLSRPRLSLSRRRVRSCPEATICGLRVNGKTGLTAVAIAAALLATGCGGSKQSLDRAYIDIEFSALDLRIADDVLKNANDLPDATSAYIALTRKYHSALGGREIAKRLTDKANELEQWCGVCVSELDRERQLVGG